MFSVSKLQKLMCQIQWLRSVNKILKSIRKLLLHLQFFQSPPGINFFLLQQQQQKHSHRLVYRPRHVKIQASNYFLTQSVNFPRAMRCSKTGLNLPLEHFWVVSNFTYCRKQVQFTLRIHIIFPFVSFPVNSASN